MKTTLLIFFSLIASVYIGLLAIHNYKYPTDTLSAKAITKLCEDPTVLSKEAQATLTILVDRIAHKDCKLAGRHYAAAKSLWIKDRRIKDLTPLKYMTKLERLILSGNNITDLTPLSPLTELEYLDLSRNHIKDLSPISKLPRLRYLDLKYNKVDSTKDLNQITELNILDLSNNRLTSVPRLQLNDLELLRVDENPIEQSTCNQSILVGKNVWTWDDECRVNISLKK